MKKLLACLLGLFVISALAGCGARPYDLEVSKPEHVKNTYYAQHSFQFYRGIHRTTNPRIGELVPVNSKVTLLQWNRRNNEFLIYDHEKRVDIYVRNFERYSKLSMKDIFKRMFKKTPVSLDAFDEETRWFIKQGLVTKGMSKDAVILALGYPPAHRTPSLSLDKWTYWKTYHLTFDVYFDKDGKVLQIINY